MDFIMLYKTPVMGFLKLNFSRSTYKVYLELFSKASSKKQKDSQLGEEYYGGVKQIAENTGLSRQAIYKAIKFLSKSYYEDRINGRTVYKEMDYWTEEEVEKEREIRFVERLPIRYFTDPDLTIEEQAENIKEETGEEVEVITEVIEKKPWHIPYVAKHKTAAGPFICRGFWGVGSIMVDRPRNYKGGFIKISVETFEKLKNLSSTEAKIYFYILFENNQKNKTWKKFSLNYLARKFKINRRRIERILKKLEEVELLDRKRSIREDNRRATTEITAATGIEVIEKKKWEKLIIQSVKLTEEEAEGFIGSAMAYAEVIGFFDYFEMDDEFEVNYESVVSGV